ncbi:MAG TPA: hypothetical protein DCS67_12270 [Clostridiales bacterium UBA8960]|jgi:prepilin-type N-terminal cleavage/methylation domain-containing protein|nr:hypothetical protein [Clostridiales bacterium UBA8960]
MKSPKKNKGVSLVEIILSIAILSLLSVYVIQMFILSKTLNNQAKNLDKSVYLSESIFELIEKDPTLEELAKRSWFVHAEMIDEESGSKTMLYFDSDWNPMEKETEGGFSLLLNISETQALAYKKFDYQIVIYSHENREMEQIYEIEMQKYR